MPPSLDLSGLASEVRSRRSSTSPGQALLVGLSGIDVVLVEGIFIYKRAHRSCFDLAVWIDCSFETALERALCRTQEGLPPAGTIAAYETIYFPAQRLHWWRDKPRRLADRLMINDPRLSASREALRRGIGSAGDRTSW